MVSFYTMITVGRFRKEAARDYVAFYFFSDQVTVTISW